MERITDNLLTTEIYGYCRISVDEELDKDNTSIENQKNIITDFAKKKFPKCNLLFFVDRDRSGYTFEQREQYQQLRLKLMEGRDNKILIVKDFSRFSRRNSKGLVELEDLRDAGVRIISIGDSIDYPTFDDWMAIQFRFLINELPVTDASKKVRTVIRRMQEDGKWLCTVPYGYVITNMKKQEIDIVADEADVIRKIFSLYNEGWGYKRIANYLTEQNIPTPRMKEKARIEARGDDYKRGEPKRTWSLATIQDLLQDDFYIGTLRAHKYRRKKINGDDVKVDPDEHYVFENHHAPIVDERTWRITQELMKQRTTTNYRGIKKYDNVYSGFMVCGDCGSPMFSMSRGDLAAAYICGTYHRRGKIGCTSHHVRADMLDAVLKQYVRKVRDNSADMMKQLEASIKNEPTEIKENENTLAILERYLADAKDELKVIKKRKIKELAKLEAQGDTDSQAKVEIVEEAYAELEDEVTLRIAGLQSQIRLTEDKHNDIIRINRLARTVIDVFDDILEKPALDRTDLQLIIDKIVVFEDRIDVKLKADIDSLLKAGQPRQEEAAGNFRKDSKVILPFGKHISTLYICDGESPTTTNVRLKSYHTREQLFTVNVVNNGDPLEIFTNRDGEIMLKKYSPVGELSEFAASYAEALAQAVGALVCITDRDYIIAAAGSGRKELEGEHLSRDVEELMEKRGTFAVEDVHSELPIVAKDWKSDHKEAVLSTITCNGDCQGSVIMMGQKEKSAGLDVLKALALSAAGFLGKQMEQ